MTKENGTRGTAGSAPIAPLVRLGLLLAAWSLAGCSSSPQGAGEPSPREVRRQLAQRLAANPEHLILSEFHQEGENSYAGKAEGPDGTTYQLKVTTQGRSMKWRAEGEQRFGKSEPPILGGWMTWAEPPFDERYPEAMQWLRAVACVLQSLVVVWAVLGPLGYRRRYSPRAEKILTVLAAVSLGFAMMWGYQFVTNRGAE